MPAAVKRGHPQPITAGASIRNGRSRDPSRTSDHPQEDLIASDNQTVIVGNLFDDPELRFTPNGTPVANLRVAVTQRVLEGGAWRDGQTSFFRVSAWRETATHLAESLHKGDRVVVLGRLRQRSWETPEGERRSVAEIEADEVGASLKWSTAKVERDEHDSGGP
jgi:single-strand DNA-binding protein